MEDAKWEQMLKDLPPQFRLYRMALKFRFPHIRDHLRVFAGWAIEEELLNTEDAMRLCENGNLSMILRAENEIGERSKNTDWLVQEKEIKKQERGLLRKRTVPNNKFDFEVLEKRIEELKDKLSKEKEKVDEASQHLDECKEVIKSMKDYLDGDDNMNLLTRLNVARKVGQGSKETQLRGGEFEQKVIDLKTKWMVKLKATLVEQISKVKQSVLPVEFQGESDAWIYATHQNVSISQMLKQGSKLRPGVVVECDIAVTCNGYLIALGECKAGLEGQSDAVYQIMRQKYIIGATTLEESKTVEKWMGEKAYLGTGEREVAECSITWPKQTEKVLLFEQKECGLPIGIIFTGPREAHVLNLSPKIRSHVGFALCGQDPAMRDAELLSLLAKSKAFTIEEFQDTSVLYHEQILSDVNPGDEGADAEGADGDEGAETLLATFERMKKILKTMKAKGTFGTEDGYRQFMEEFKSYKFPQVQDGDQQACDEFEDLKRESPPVTQMKLDTFKKQHRDLAGHTHTMVLLKKFLSKIAQINPDTEDSEFEAILNGHMEEFSGVKVKSFVFETVKANLAQEFIGGRRIILKITHMDALPSNQATVDTEQEGLFVGERKANLYIVSASATPAGVTEGTQLVMTWWRDQGCFGSAYYTEEGAQQDKKGLDFFKISSGRPPKSTKVGEWFQKLEAFIASTKVSCLHGVIKII